MAKNDNELEVTLARDLPGAGPRGGTVKADQSVKLPRGQAELLLLQGRARLTHPERDTATGAPANVTLNPTGNTGGAAPGDDK